MRKAVFFAAVSVGSVLGFAAGDQLARHTTLLESPESIDPPFSNVGPVADAYREAVESNRAAADDTLRIYGTLIGALAVPAIIKGRENLADHSTPDNPES